MKAGKQLIVFTHNSHIPTPLASRTASEEAEQGKGVTLILPPTTGMPLTKEAKETLFTGWTGARMEIMITSNFFKPVHGQKGKPEVLRSHRMGF